MTETEAKYSILIERLINPKPFEITLGKKKENEEPQNNILENLRISSECKEITIYVPISCEPNPPILGVIATTIQIVEAIRKKNPDPKLENNIHIKFLFWGNIIFDIPLIREEFAKHFELYLPDREEDTIKNLITLRKVEFETFIKNIFLNVAWNNRFPSALIMNIEFEDLFNESNHSLVSDLICNEIANENNIPDACFIEDNVDFVKFKKEIYLYNNTDGSAYQKKPTSIEIALNILDKISKNPVYKEILVLPETGYNIISHLANNQEIKNYYTHFDDNITNSLVWFSEVSRGSSPFPTYYNGLSKYYFENLESEKIDELYFAGMLKYLNSRLFSTTSDGANTQFQEMIDEINRIREDLKRFDKKIKETQDSLDNSTLTPSMRETGDKDIIGYNAGKRAVAETYYKYLGKKFRDEVFNAIEYGFLDSQQLILQQFELII